MLLDFYHKKAWDRRSQQPHPIHYISSLRIGFMKKSAFPDVPDFLAPDFQKNSRMVARTPSIEEANRIAEQYSMQGYEAKIVKRGQAGLALYEVWISKKPDIIS